MHSDFSDLDENLPKPREFHQAVHDTSTEAMYVLGGSESHGRVNYVHRFQWKPQEHNDGHVDRSTLISELTKLMDFQNDQKSFMKFELIFRDSNNKKVCTLFAPVAFVKVRCPRLFKQSELASVATEQSRQVFVEPISSQVAARLLL